MIETTGLADPYPVLQTLGAHPTLCSNFAAGGLLSSVAAVNAGRQIAHRAEAVCQIVAADRIVLTKTDLACDDTVRSLTAALAGVNPTADVMPATAALSLITGDL